MKKPDIVKFDSNKNYYWLLQTNKGTIKIKLMPDVAPMHVSSTIYLTLEGFYNDLRFHRVIPGFMAQGGCPLGNGRGEPGYKYKGEFDSKVKHDKAGILSMANAGPGTDGSQFFLTFKATPWLDGKHTIFGVIVEGMDVLNKLEASGSKSGQTSELLFIIKATIVTKSTVAGKIVVKVGDKQITQDQLDERMNEFIKKQFQGKDINENLKAQLVVKYKKSIVTSLINNILVQIDAEELGVVITDKDYNQEMDKQVKRIMISNNWTREEFEKSAWRK